MPRGAHKTVFYAEAKLNLHTAEALFYVNEALFEAAQEIIGFNTVATAQALAPVLSHATKERKPGELRDSINARVTRISSGKRTGVRASVTTSCGYGGFVELGTRKTPKHPFLWPAFEQNIQRLIEAVRENLQNLVGGTGQGSAQGIEGEEDHG